MLLLVSCCNVGSYLLRFILIENTTKCTFIYGFGSIKPQRDTNTILQDRFIANFPLLLHITSMKSSLPGFHSEVCPPHRWFAFPLYNIHFIPCSVIEIHTVLYWNTLVVMVIISILLEKLIDACSEKSAQYLICSNYIRDNPAFARHKILVTLKSVFWSDICICQVNVLAYSCAHTYFQVHNSTKQTLFASHLILILQIASA